MLLFSIMTAAIICSPPSMNMHGKAPLLHQLYTNSKGEYAWLVQNLCYDSGSNFISNSSIEYNGVDAKKMTFSNGQMDSEILAQVDGEKWTGKKPSKFYAFGETYNNTDDFLKQIRFKWTWETSFC